MNRIQRIVRRLRHCDRQPRRDSWDAIMRSPTTRAGAVVELVRGRCERTGSGLMPLHLQKRVLMMHHEAELCVELPCGCVGFVTIESANVRSLGQGINLSQRFAACTCQAVKSHTPVTLVMWVIFVQPLSVAFRCSRSSPTTSMNAKVNPSNLQRDRLAMSCVAVSVNRVPVSSG